MHLTARFTCSEQGAGKMGRCKDVLFWEGFQLLVRGVTCSAVRMHTPGCVSPPSLSSLASHGPHPGLLSAPHHLHLVVPGWQSRALGGQWYHPCCRQGCGASTSHRSPLRHTTATGPAYSVLGCPHTGEAVSVVLSKNSIKPQYLFWDCTQIAYTPLLRAPG